MRQGSAKVTHLTFLHLYKIRGTWIECLKFLLLYGDFSFNEKQEQSSRGVKSHFSTQTQGFPDPAQCPRQLHVCNCRELISQRRLWDQKNCINSAQKYKSWPHCNISNIISTSPLVTVILKSHPIYFCIMLFVLQQMAISRHESAFVCLCQYKTVLQHAHTQREALQNSLSIAYKQVNLSGFLTTGSLYSWISHLPY